jgi:7-cyano-7-deazaguanine reductase
MNMSGRKDSELEGVTLLGNQGTNYLFNYSPDVLETFENKHPNRDYFVKFNCPEFTSLCPKTNQPDFATIYISYIPGELMVESKSLKLYLFSFRNHGDFHEDCMNIIMNDLIDLMDPKYIEVWGKFTPRGGLLALEARPHAEGVCFCVRDSGCGIDPRHLPSIFERFWQHNSEDKRGAGLGLTISKGIVEAHQGRIWVESEHGQGTHVCFTLPAARQDNPPSCE